MYVQHHVSKIILNNAINYYCLDKVFFIIVSLGAFRAYDENKHGPLVLWFKYCLMTSINSLKKI